MVSVSRQTWPSSSKTRHASIRGWQKRTAPGSDGGVPPKRRDRRGVGAGGRKECALLTSTKGLVHKAGQLFGVSEHGSAMASSQLVAGGRQSMADFTQPIDDPLLHPGMVGVNREDKPKPDRVATSLIVLQRGDRLAIGVGLRGPIARHLSWGRSSKAEYISMHSTSFCAFSRASFSSAR